MTKAFEPYQFAGKTLNNHIAMAPMTRSRALEPGMTATPLMANYYAQRASAGLIITEGIQPSAVGQGYTNTPGLHSAKQVAAWKVVTDAVHQKGGVIFAQLMHTGRIGHASLLPDGLVPVGPSALQAQGQVFTHEGPKDFPVPRELTEEEIFQTIQDFALAARNAVAAGFDGIELHGATGYLIHQFLAPNANQHTDQWGGSAENRVRFATEVAAAVVQAIGADRVGIRIAPGVTLNDIADDSDLDATYGLLVSKLADLNLAYLHLMESAGRDLTDRLHAAWPNTFILNPQTGRTPTGADALDLIDAGVADMIAYGVMFLANPDLPARLAAGGPYNAPNPSTFYSGTAEGYTDYPFLD
ncbi:alkene reductase [Deinococcus marmoris]|uniref:2,4-dienoyl-CoA reductase [NADPH] n=1 Tax=Deinococcus marmoris TaxID=249408 RepID=A0A1U7NT76_9DEIO|nr:alkene reductase [Deinococcus marmoris]OLV16116.1 2,4-dienoyl-CoA reductase [NADPH] [Deinococcus marmoris]